LLASTPRNRAERSVGEADSEEFESRARSTAAGAKRPRMSTAVVVVVVVVEEEEEVVVVVDDDDGDTESAEEEAAEGVLVGEVEKA